MFMIFTDNNKNLLKILNLFWHDFKADFGHVIKTVSFHNDNDSNDVVVPLGL